MKPTKCRSFSISAGKPTIIPYKLGDFVIPSVAEEEQKFLGKKIIFSGKQSEYLAEVRSILEEKLENLDKLAIRNEFKIVIFTRYLIPSIRFVLTVYDLTSTSLSNLDKLADKFVKRWLGVPKCASNTVLHSKRTFNIPKVSDGLIIIQL